MKNKVTSFFKTIVNFYNSWYGIIDCIIVIFTLQYFHNTTIQVLLIGLAFFEAFVWYRNIFRNLNVKRELFATFKENNSFAILGGLGSGKSTIANYLLTTFTPKELRYYNIFNPGFKAFTNAHLLLQKKLEDGAGVLIDEAGAQVDAFHYSKSDNQTRKRIEILNKFFRQWYGDKAHLIYVDQAQRNMNTSLYSNVYYVIQCKGVDKRPSSIIPYLISKVVLFFINKPREKFNKENEKQISAGKISKKFLINNPFTNVSIEFMEFLRLGDYADHYNVQIQDRDHKKLVCPIYKLFGSLDTYVFKNFNPAKKDKKPYVWGTSKIRDRRIMETNFSLNEAKKKIDDSFLEI